jgi:hypothetical protein
MQKNAYFNELLSLNWHCLEEASKKAPLVLQGISQNRALFKDMILNIKKEDQLYSLCEHYDILDKLVIFSDVESGVRVRLHIFLPGYFDRPHMHRWNYVSLILRGEYQHYIYSNSLSSRDGFELDKLEITMSRKETEGSSYALHHSSIHSIVAQPFTVSLVVRGPSMKDRFLVADRQTKKVWWQYGAKDEKIEEKRMKRMSPERMDYLIDKLAELRII